MSLQDWLRNGWLKEHKTSRQEIADLLKVADRDIAACQTPNLVPDWKFNIAYNAALQLASAALAAAGYQADRASHHYRVIHSLEFTLGTDPTTVRKFDIFRKKRNITDYERAETVSELEQMTCGASLSSFVAKWQPGSRSTTPNTRREHP